MLTNSARREEEELKLLSLFDGNYRPVAGRPYECSFEIVHPNLKFIFDESRLGPQGSVPFPISTNNRC